MKLQAKIIKGTKTLAEDELIFSEQGSFQKQLEQCFVDLTSFNSDQFLEPIDFDRFEIRFIK